MSLRVGVDVGGTNSDAVVSDASEVEGWAKVRTTEDVTTASIGAALENSSAGESEGWHSRSAPTGGAESRAETPSRGEGERG